MDPSGRRIRIYRQFKLAMQFNPGDGSGAVDEINDLCDTDNDSYSLASKARRLNSAIWDLELMALQIDGTWRFDDKNFSSNPTGLMSATDGNPENSFDSSLVMIERVEILLTDGVSWQELDEYDQVNGPLTATDLAVEATPQAYYKRGNKFIFTSVPKSTNMTLTNGIRVTFKRLGTAFTASDTTAVIGLQSPFDVLACQKASVPYCNSYKRDRVPGLLRDIADGEKKWRAYIANRSRDGAGKMTMKRVSGR